MTENVKKESQRASRTRLYFLSIIIFTLAFTITYSIIAPNMVPSFLRGLFEDDEETKERLFDPVITKREKEAFKRALTVFNDAVQSNLTYMLYGGTLLGSYRHHDMIPWDDDLDLLISVKDKKILKECLTTQDSEYELNTRFSHSWKFSHNGSIRTRFGWKWPFLDIFFYQEDDDLIWDTHSNWAGVKYKKKDVFPLIERPFMGMLLPAPRNTRHVLSQLYDVDTCKSNSWNHKEEKKIKERFVVEIPCGRLRNKYSFVKRVFLLNETIETLEDVNNETLYENYTVFTLPN